MTKKIIFGLLLILVDQLVKYIIRYFGGFYICNQGIAFGINTSKWLIIGVFILFCLFVIAEKTGKFKSLNVFGRDWIPIALIASGAVSNMIDRIYYGCVIDFIDLKIWPVFNLADAFIAFGAIMIVVKILKSDSARA